MINRAAKSSPVAITDFSEVNFSSLSAFFSASKATDAPLKYFFDETSMCIIHSSLYLRILERDSRMYEHTMDLNVIFHSLLCSNVYENIGMKTLPTFCSLRAYI